MERPAISYPVKYKVYVILAGVSFMRETDLCFAVGPRAQY